MQHVASHLELPKRPELEPNSGSRQHPGQASFEAPGCPERYSRGDGVRVIQTCYTNQQALYRLLSSSNLVVLSV